MIQRNNMQETVYYLHLFTLHLLSVCSYVCTSCPITFDLFISCVCEALHSELFKEQQPGQLVTSTFHATKHFKIFEAFTSPTLSNCVTLAQRLIFLNSVDLLSRVLFHSWISFCSQGTRAVHLDQHGRSACSWGGGLFLLRHVRLFVWLMELSTKAEETKPSAKKKIETTQRSKFPIRFRIFKPKATCYASTTHTPPNMFPPEHCQLICWLGKYTLWRRKIICWMLGWIGIQQVSKPCWLEAVESRLSCS